MHTPLGRGLGNPLARVLVRGLGNPLGNPLPTRVRVSIRVSIILNKKIYKKMTILIRDNDSEYILNKKFNNGNIVLIRYSKEVFKTDIYVNGILRKRKFKTYKKKVIRICYE